MLADGRIVRADPDENADLFWGLRGGGGNFGVVTEFEFRAHELTVLPILATFHPLEHAAEVLRTGERLMSDPKAPDELLWTSFMRRGPAEAPWMTDELEGTPGVMSLIEWSGDVDEGHELLREIERRARSAGGRASDRPLPRDPVDHRRAARARDAPRLPQGRVHDRADRRR